MQYLHNISFCTSDIIHNKLSCTINDFPHNALHITYPQCTSMGPGLCCIQTRTRRRHSSTELGLGQSWSLQLANWKCFTIRSSASPSWTIKINLALTLLIVFAGNWLYKILEIFEPAWILFCLRNMDWRLWRSFEEKHTNLVYLTKSIALKFMSTHKFDLECPDAEIRQDVSTFQPYVNAIIAAMLVMPILLTLLLKHRKKSTADKETWGNAGTRIYYWNNFIPSIILYITLIAAWYLLYVPTLTGYCISRLRRYM